MTEPTITCPNCKTEILLTESLAAPLIAATRKQFEQQLAQKDQAIASMRQKIEELKQKAEQGSQQMQGEAQELELENVLRARFPFDGIDPVPKGEFGGDVLQRVVNHSGQACGTILWESKRTKNWSDIIKTGSTLPAVRQLFGDFEEWMIDGCGLSDAAVLVVNVMLGEPLPPVDSLSGVIITGSPAMVTDQADWMRSLAAWIPQVLEQKAPLLGVCFGHQILAQAMGGGVQFHPEFSADIMRAYVSEQADSLQNQGHDVAAIQEAIEHTDAANALLKRFYGYCVG